MLCKNDKSALLRKLCLLFLVNSSFCEIKHEEACENQFVTRRLSGGVSGGTLQGFCGLFKVGGSDKDCFEHGHYLEA